MNPSRKRINAWHTKFAFTTCPSGAKIVDEEEINFANKVNEELKKERATLKDVIELKYGQSLSLAGGSSGLEIR